MLHSSQAQAQSALQVTADLGSSDITPNLGKVSAMGLGKGLELD